jgi:hypothetical protein
MCCDIGLARTDGLSLFRRQRSPSDPCLPDRCGLPLVAPVLIPATILTTP